MEIRKKGNMSRASWKEFTFSQNKTRKDSLSFLKTVLKYLEKELDL